MFVPVYRTPEGRLALAADRRSWDWPHVGSIALEGGRAELRAEGFPPLRTTARASNRRILSELNAQL